MASTIQELIKKASKIHFENITDVFEKKLSMISNHFGDIETFLDASKNDLEKMVFLIGEPTFKLNENDFEKIESLRKSGLFDKTISIQENFVRILIKRFVAKQLEMIEKLDLDDLNVNPILIGALNLNNEKDLAHYYVYQAISRSMVTSVGFLVQNLLLYSNEYVLDGKDDLLGEKTKWDLVVQKIDCVKTYLEAKSGTNDINKAQMHHYAEEILAIEKQGFRAYIGETYGKRDDKTVTHGLFKKYLPDWEERTLIGKELWFFLTEDDEYHNKLIDMLFKASNAIMGNQTFIQKIEEKILLITSKFQKKYKSYNNFLKSLW